MDIPLVGKIVLYADIIFLGIYCIIIFVWQLNVLQGRAMKNPDGTVDDWHDHKLFYGIALADIAIAIPVTLLGIILIFLNLKPGYYLAGLGSFWFLWANVMATSTSLRFEKPKITFSWFITFPLGVIVGLVYIIWSLIYFEVVF